MTDYSKMTDQEFDNILVSILEKMKASELLSISGIYEILSEHFNNEVLEIWESQQATRRAERE